MEIQPLSSLFPVSSSAASQGTAGDTVQAGVKSFGDLLNQALQGVNSLQNNAQQLAGQVATGDASSFHDAVIASEKAMLSLQLASQVQNKVIQAYNTIMSMQI
jgi:flagellar hook-basal body complex protein FliE